MRRGFAYIPNFAYICKSFVECDAFGHNLIIDKFKQWVQYLHFKLLAPFTQIKAIVAINSHFISFYFISFQNTIPNDLKKSKISSEKRRK